MMKYFILCLFLILNIFTISCSDERNLGNEYIEGKDAQYMFMTTDGERYITRSEEGYYFINGWYLYYSDFNTMNPIVLCNKPNCLHDKELDETKKFNCNAFLLTGNNTTLLTIYNNYIYCYIDYDFLKDGTPVPELIRISLDGSERKTICELEEDITSMALHRGVLYYSTAKVPTDKMEEEQGISY